MTYLHTSLAAVLFAGVASSALATDTFPIDPSPFLPASTLAAPMLALADVATPVLILGSNGVALQFAQNRLVPVFDPLHDTSPNYGLATQLIAPGPGQS